MYLYAEAADKWFGNKKCNRYEEAAEKASNGEADTIADGQQEGRPDAGRGRPRQLGMRAARAQR